MQQTRRTSSRATPSTPPATPVWTIQNSIFAFVTILVVSLGGIALALSSSSSSPRTKSSGQDKGSAGQMGPLPFSPHPNASRYKQLFNALYSQPAVNGNAKIRRVSSVQSIQYKPIFGAFMHPVISTLTNWSARHPDKAMGTSDIDFAFYDKIDGAMPISSIEASTNGTETRRNVFGSFPLHYSTALKILNDIMVGFEGVSTSPDSVKLRRKLGIVRDVPTCTSGSACHDDRDRVECGDTDDWAWRTIVSIGGYCTGTLVSPDVVLTAGHCVYDTDENEWMWPNAVAVHPCSSSDDPVRTYTVTRMRTFVGWTRDASRAFDIAVMKLAPDSSGAKAGSYDGWKSFGWKSTIPTSWTYNIAGYPGDKPSRTMWTDWGTTCVASQHSDCTTNPGPNWVLHRLDTRGGQSGSGTYRYTPGSSPERIIWFVHVAWSGLTGETATDTSYNRATRIRKFMFASFCDFIADTTVC